MDHRRTTRTRILHTAATLLLYGLLAGCTGNTAAADTHLHVVIEQTTPAYTVFAGLTDEQKAKFDAQRPADSELVDWPDFPADAEKHVTARIVHDDYPNVDVTAGVLALIRRYPGAPIGLTWNGGIAITYNDYRHAETGYAMYQKDPKAYEAWRPHDRRADPIHPLNHLGPLLGW